jgi:hypothetical protein
MVNNLYQKSMSELTVNPNSSNCWLEKDLTHLLTPQ